MTVTDLSLVVPSRANFGHERHCSLVSMIRAEANFLGCVAFSAGFEKGTFELQFVSD